jgi:hypothetical protein
VGRVSPVAEPVAFSPWVAKLDEGDCPALVRDLVVRQQSISVSRQDSILVFNLIFAVRRGNNSVIP